MEPTGEEEPKPSQKQLEEDGRWRGEQSRLYLVAAWKDSPKQTKVASNGFRGPMLHWEQKGLMMMMTNFEIKNVFENFVWAKTYVPLFLKP